MLTERDTQIPPNLTTHIIHRQTLSTWLAVVGISVLSLLPRCLSLSDFMTMDEAYHWIGRVHRFSDAVAAGDWYATKQTGHPGVTVMWLGSLGRLLAALRGIYDSVPEGNSMAYLAMLRLPIAVFNSLAVVLGYLILRRLVLPQVALLVALLWATSPFLIGFDRLLHLDGTLTSLMLLSLLLLLVATNIKTQTQAARGWRSLIIGRWWLVGSGICAGFALLTKSPALLLLPVSGLLLLAVPAPSLRERLRRTATSYIVWLAVIGVVGVLCWPAVWVAPIKAARSVVREIKYNGGEPHQGGNYFMGERVDDPGLPFYPVMVLLRSTPVTLFGLVLLPLAFRRREDRPLLLKLALFVALFGAIMSIEPKKFDRYILPIWPVLEIFAAAGLVAFWDVISQRFARTKWRHAPLILLTILPAIVTNWRYQPYYLAYFNPLVGGGAVAQRTTLVGWGEGMEQIGAWLNTRPDLQRGPVISWMGPTLSPFVAQRVIDLHKEPLDPHGIYGVRYVRMIQRDEEPEAQIYVQQTPPLYTLRMYGIDYAVIYQLPRPFDQPLDASFGNGLHLRGFSQTDIHNTVVITPSWDIQADQLGGQFNFVHLLAVDDAVVAHSNALIDGGMFRTWQKGQQFDNPLSVTIPTDLPPGTYRLVLGVYDPTSGTHLPLKHGLAAQANAVLLATINLTR